MTCRRTDTSNCFGMALALLLAKRNFAQKNCNNINSLAAMRDSAPGTIPLALDAGVGGQTDGIRCVIAFIEHGFCVDQIRGAETCRETGIDTGHVIRGLRSFAAGSSASAKNL